MRLNRRIALNLNDTNFSTSKSKEFLSCLHCQSIPWITFSFLNNMLMTIFLIRKVISNRKTIKTDNIIIKWQSKCCGFAQREGRRIKKYSKYW